MIPPMMRPRDHSSATSFKDAVFEAHFRADITGYRYRVRYDRANKLWDITETTTRMQR